jgi:hypothetical protein
MARRSAQVRFAPSPQSAARARRFVARTLAVWQVLTGAAETAVLLTSELVTNAPAVQSKLGRPRGGRRRATQTVWISVHDADPRMP